MATAKKTSSSKKQTDEQKAKVERVTAGQPITQSGLSGPTQDDLNPAFAPDASEPK